MTTKREVLLAMAGVVLLLPLAAFAAPAAEGSRTSCKMTFSLREWSVDADEADGAGSISCSNGQTAEVTIRSTGGGLTAEKFRIQGRGEFSGVRDIHEIFGSYVALEESAGVVKTGTATVLTKGEVFVELNGKGEGWDPALGLGKFTIEPRH